MVKTQQKSTDAGINIAMEEIQEGDLSQYSHGQSKDCEHTQKCR